MNLSMPEKAFVGAFATSVVALGIAGTVSDATELYWAGVILILPWSMLVLGAILPLLGLAYFLTQPLRVIGHSGTADALAGAWGALTVTTLLVGASVGQGLVLTFGVREVRRLFLNGRDRYCRHPRPA